MFRVWTLYRSFHSTEIVLRLDDFVAVQMVYWLAVPGSHYDEHSNKAITTKHPQDKRRRLS